MERKIIHNGYIYHYKGFTTSSDTREMTMHIYHCRHNKILGWKERACKALLHKVTYWSMYTDEPPHVEVIGQHNHPKTPWFRFPYPFKNMEQYKQYQEMLYGPRYKR